MNMGRKLLTVGVAGALALSSAIASAAPSMARSVASTAPAASTATVALTGSVPAFPRGAVRLGPLSAGTRIHLDVTLKVRDQAALTAFLANLSNRQSPVFHHFLKAGQFGPRFGPTLATVAAVRATLRQAGLSPGRVTSNRLSIPVTASAAAVEHAFGVSLANYRLPGGRIGYANTAAPKISGTVSRYVSGVLGLNNLMREQSMLARQTGKAPGAAPRLATTGHPSAKPTATGPQPCAAAISDGENNSGYTANQLAGYYYMSPLYTLGDLGAGVRVALFELEPNSTSDISAYKSCYKITDTIAYKKVDGGSGSGAGSGEAALDIEDVAGLTPKSAIDVYQAPNGGDTDVYDNYNAIVTADTDAVISSSWGTCELLTDATLTGDEQTVFEQANSQGQTVFAAAGDTGSTGCLRSGTDKASVSAGDPSAQPYVDGVGGTTVTTSGETVWNESSLQGGSGGGGVSSKWCIPTYQYQTAIPGLISSHSVKNSGCPAAQDKYVRETPDVTADADPYTGYVIYHSGSWSVIGGTSAAAPLWAAIAALIDASPFCTDYASGAVGVYPEGLYGIAAQDSSYIWSGGADEPEIVSDITQGNDDYTPSGYTGGLWPATTGFDMASGLGSPLVSGVGSGGSASNFFPGLAAIMCSAYATKLLSTKVTKIAPTSGTTAGGTKVTITGSGFLPIAGADEAKIGTTYVNATCTSSTTCTIVTPKHAAGAVNIQITSEDFALSPITAKDKFTYKA
jgi:subtilase family serine protease